MDRDCLLYIGRFTLQLLHGAEPIGTVAVGDAGGFQSTGPLRTQ